MNKIFTYLIVLVAFTTQNFASVDSLEVVNFLNMSIEDLMKINIKVSSIKELDVFATPSTVTIIDKNTILMYN